MSPANPSQPRVPLSPPDPASPIPNEGLPEEPPRPGVDAGPHSGPDNPWRAPFDSLVVQAGHALDALPWDAIGQQMGSWADPMFPAPAPLGSLPGLGDRYRDLTLLGEGATAKVYRAMDTLLQRPVAIKVLKNEAGSTLVEARAQAQVEHPNVCRIYEVGQWHIIMQLVEGRTLAGLAPALGLREKVRILRDIALGIQAAHVRGLIHLDLKLNNVLMQEAEDGTLVPMVSDFGMVLGSEPGEGPCPMGTPPYTSPEQVAGDPTRLDRRTDVYALGVMLYVLAANAIPFYAENVQGLLKAIAEAAPVPLRHRNPGLPVDLARIVHRCLEKDPEARYPTARELAADLDRFLADLPVEAMGGSWAYRIRKWSRRNRRTAWVGTLALAMILAMAGGMVHHNRFVAEQADWDNHFQKRVEDIRSELDHLHRLPAHDISPGLRLIQGQVGTLRDEVARGGEPAQGPGHLALGQALRLLDPANPEAVTHFQAAWDQGFHTEAARAWLVVARIHDFYQAASKGVDWLDPEADSKSRLQARERYLKPARTLLEGKGGSDQERLVHLTELAEVYSSQPYDPDRAIQVARAYRSRFPKDPDALLEEAEALAAKARALWGAQAAAARVWPPQGTPELDALRESCRLLRLEAQRIVPSNPKVYANLSEGFWQELLYPTAGSDRAEPLFEQERHWMEQGLRVSPADPRLTMWRTYSLGNEALLVRLQQGLGPGPLPGELLKAVEQALDQSDGLTLSNVLWSVRSYLAVNAAYGLPATPLITEVIGRLERAPQPGANREILQNALWTWCLVVSGYRVEAGEEPWLAPIQAGRHDFAKAGPYGWTFPFQAALLQARFLQDRGGDASRPLREAAQWAPAGGWKGPYALNLKLQLDTLQASCDPREASWQALEATLAQAEPVLPDLNQLITVVDAKLALARAGRDPDGALLKAVRRTLQTDAVRGQWTGPMLHQRRAELCLLEARRERAPAVLLQDGLREATQALVYRRPWGGAEPHWLPRAFGEAPPPHKGRTCALMGELRLALAEAEGERGARIALARQAEADFRRALTSNPNLAGSLAPLRARARAFPDPPPSRKPVPSPR